MIRASLRKVANSALKIQLGLQVYNGDLYVSREFVARRVDSFSRRAQTPSASRLVAAVFVAASTYRDEKFPRVC